MQDVELASDIMLSLKEMFGEQGRSARQETMRQIYNTKVAKGTSVREHCFRMISNLNTLEVLGADIDGESQVDMILQSQQDHSRNSDLALCPKLVLHPAFDAVEHLK